MIAATHAQLAAHQMEILFEALRRDADSVFFARSAEDRTPLPAYHILAGPYGKVSDPIIVNPMPILGYTSGGKRHMMMSECGVIVLRAPHDDGRAMREGWYHPVLGHQLYAFVAKELVPVEVELRSYE